MSGHQAERTWQSDLIERYPHLFQTETGTPGLPAVGDGWRDLVETAVRRIADAVAPAPRGSLTIGQIKEKFGTIRIYTDRHSPLPDDIGNAIEEAIALAQARSACTCEICGAEGRLFDRHTWLATLCDVHAEGEPVPARPGWENILIVRTIEGGKVRVLSCRRYDRATDSFADVPLSTLGIEKE